LIEALNEKLKVLPEYLAQKKENGSKIIGYFCNYVPEELIKSADAVPLRLVSGGNPEAMQAGEQYVKPYCCPYIRSCIGNRANENPLYKYLDAICVAGTCDGMKNVEEYWRKYFNIPVFSIGVPKVSNRFRTREYTSEYFRAELTQFKRDLEKLTGIRITNKALKESIRFYNLMRSRMRRLYDYLNIESSQISWRDIFRISHIGYQIDRNEFLSQVENILKELSIKTNSTETRAKQVRLMLYGSIMAFEDTKVLDIIEVSGGKIVADALCTGSRFWRKDVSIEGSLIDGLVDRYLYNIPCAHMMDFMMRLNYVIAAARESKSQGLIYYNLKSCDTYRSEFREFEEDIKKELGIPSLLIETEYSPADIGTTRTKIEAFLEMLRGV
jgi:benzoyl-CoA reductase/2-hydroxyglutaryl-CoA dehydratase subunit BcrC/BadD/HgdB